MAGPGLDAGRRQHGHLRPDHHHHRRVSLEQRRQRTAAELPGPGHPLLGHGRCLRRPGRQAASADRHQHPAGRCLPGDLLQRQQPGHALPADAAGLDDHDVLRTCRSLDDPVPGPQGAAARRQRALHADDERGLRSRLCPSWAVPGRPGERSAADPDRGRALFRGGGLLLDAAALTACRIRIRQRRPDGGRRRTRGRDDGRAVRGGHHLHPRAPQRQLVAVVSRRDGRSHRNTRRARLRLRPVDAPPGSQGLRPGRPAPGSRRRNGHPRPQLVRPLSPETPDHRSRA